MDHDLISYYERIFELNGMSHLSDRVTFIFPESQKRPYPAHFSLIQKLILSAKSLKRIKSFIKNKPAYVVPQYNSNEYVKLCCYLDIPLYGGNQ